jgi:isoleucyl-tRNA synthetase
LYECLLTTAKLIAPFVPFVAEAIWQNLAVAATSGHALESVHLTDFPTGAVTTPFAQWDWPNPIVSPQPMPVTPQPNVLPLAVELSERMHLVREIVSLGRSARMSAKLKVRQPLSKVEVVLAQPQHQQWLEAHAALIREELNVKQVDFITRADQYITYSALPDLKRLGPRLGKRLPVLRQALAAADAAEILSRLQADSHVTFELADGPVILDANDIQVRMQAKPGWAAAQGALAVVVISTELTGELIKEGLAREVVHAVQTRRKDLDCQYTDRIEIGLTSESFDLVEAVARFGDYIMSETLAANLKIGELNGVEPARMQLADYDALVYVKVLA